MSISRELAWAAIRRQPGRFVVLAASVALPVLLVLDLCAVYLGLLDAMAGFPRALGGDMIVAQSGTSAILLRSTSRIPADAVEAVRRIPGVARVDELVGRLAYVEQHEGGSPVFVVGIFPDDLVGGPVAMLEGGARPAPGDVVVDRVLAHDLGLEIGASLQIAGAPLRVSGIAHGGNAVLGTFAWVHRSVLALASPADPSHLVLRLEPSADAAAVRRAVAGIGSLRAYATDELVAEAQAAARQIFRPLVGLVAGIASIVGALVLALSSWTAAMERRVEYGLLRAIGIPTRQIYAASLWQAGIAAATGVAVGTACGIAVARGIGTVLPRFVTTITVGTCVAVAVGAFAAGLLASWIPVRRAVRTDPALVFRA